MCLKVVVKPWASSGKYILPVSPSCGSSIQLMCGSSGFIVMWGGRLAGRTHRWHLWQAGSLPHEVSPRPIVGHQRVEIRGHDPGAEKHHPRGTEDSQRPSQAQALRVAHLADFVENG